MKRFAKILGLALLFTIFSSASGAAAVDTVDVPEENRPVSPENCP